MEKILLVEDEARIRNIVLDYFTAHGLSCDLARNGEEALDILRDNDYDAILLDILMPGLDGFLCRKCNAKTNPLERRYCIHVKRDVYFDYWNVFGRAFEWTIDFWDACRCYNSSHRQIQSKRSCAYFITPLFDGLCNHRGFSANKNVGQ